MHALLLTLVLGAQCVDYSKDPAGCQPSTFDTPIGDMPSVRIGRTGNLDPKSSEADARAGAQHIHARVMVRQADGFPDVDANSLGDDGELDPVRTLREALNNKANRDSSFWILEHGEGRDVPQLS